MTLHTNTIKTTSHLSSSSLEHSMEEDQDEEEIDAQRLQIEDNQSRRLSPGTALIHESLTPSNVNGTKNGTVPEAKQRSKKMTKTAVNRSNPTRSSSNTSDSDMLIKQSSNHG